MHILIAPDKLKGSLTAPDAAHAIARGVLRAAPAATVDLCPLSDGGEGFVETLIAARSGERRTTSVTGPVGDAVQAHWGILPDGTAVLESAQAIGLALVPEARRNPGETTSVGLGELLRAALDAGARRILLGVGGSGVNDGGAGMAAALGVRFAPHGAAPTGDGLVALSSVDRSGLDPRLAEVELVVATDVTNPLTGPHGASRTFAAQKGADGAQIEALEQGLTHWAALLGDGGEQPGDGAAGGVGYALRVLAGARLSSGAERVLDGVCFDARLRAASLVIAGEGRVDAQTTHGKILSVVCRRAAARGVPVVALVGGKGDGLEPLYQSGLTACFSITDGPCDLTDALRRGGALLEAAAFDVVRLMRARS